MFASQSALKIIFTNEVLSLFICDSHFGSKLLVNPTFSIVRQIYIRMYYNTRTQAWSCSNQAVRSNWNLFDKKSQFFVFSHDDMSTHRGFMTKHCVITIEMRGLSWFEPRCPVDAPPTCAPKGEPGEYAPGIRRVSFREQERHEQELNLVTSPPRWILLSVQCTEACFERKIAVMNSKCDHGEPIKHGNCRNRPEHEEHGWTHLAQSREKTSEDKETMGNRKNREDSTEISHRDPLQNADHKLWSLSSAP